MVLVQSVRSLLLRFLRRLDGKANQGLPALTLHGRLEPHLFE